MPRLPIPAAALVTALALASAASHAQRPPGPDGPWFSGYLCCNMRAYGRTISDINYDEGGNISVIPAGTPARVVGYEAHWFNVDLGGRRMTFRNGYHRDIGSVALARRFIVDGDPRAKLGAYPPAEREAIEAMRVAPGMTREQVAMALGHPVSTENPDLDARVWRYWLDSWTEFHVNFDEAGRVEKVVGEPQVLTRVLASGN